MNLANPTAIPYSIAPEANNIHSSSFTVFI